MPTIKRDNKGRFLKGFVSPKKIGADLNCLICNKSFHIKPSAIKKGQGRYCSMLCRNIAFKGQHHSKNTEFKKGSFARLGIRHTEKSKQKMSISRKGKRMGKLNNRWKGGITPINHKIRTSAEFLNWAKTIKERDNFECQICGKVGIFLHSNHIKKFCDYPELRFDLKNGITICRDCDNKWVKFHEEQWESYFNFNLMVRGVIYG